MAHPAPATIHLVLAEYASVHVDGTASVLRGWITNWTLATVPAVVQMHLLMDVPNGEPANKERDFSLTITASSGLQVATVQGKLGQGIGPSSQYPIPLSFQVVDFGVYLIRAESAGMSGVVSLEVKPKEKSGSLS